MQLLLFSQAVLDEQTKWRRHCESNPDNFYRNEVYGLIDEVRVEVAAMVGAEAEDVVILENASEGMNAILKSLAAPGAAVRSCLVVPITGRGAGAMGRCPLPLPLPPLRRARLTPGHRCQVLYLDLAYFMVAETIRFLRDTQGSVPVEVGRRRQRGGCWVEPPRRRWGCRRPTTLFRVSPLSTRNPFAGWRRRRRRLARTGVDGGPVSRERRGRL